jgi:hypothetical protein
LYVDFLQKCETSGTENLQKVLDFASSLKPKIKKVCLWDDSTIELCNKTIKLPLKMLRILATGASWYNSFGFKSDIYSEEVKTNTKLISSTFSDVMNKIYLQYLSSAYNALTFNSNENKKLGESKQKEFVSTEFYNMIESALGLTESEINQLTVQQLFKGLLDYIFVNKNNCTDKIFLNNVRIIMVLTRILNQFISYDVNLCLNIEDKASAKRKRSLDTNSVFEVNKKGGKKSKKFQKSKRLKTRKKQRYTRRK